jgi:uncharacterized protein YgiM (DUF1202 family)
MKMNRKLFSAIALTTAFTFSAVTGAAPLAQPQVAKASTEEAWYSISYYKVTPSQLNVRSAAGSHAKVIGKLSKGNIIQVKDYNFKAGWTLISYNVLFLLDNKLY